MSLPPEQATELWREFDAWCQSPFDWSPGEVLPHGADERCPNPRPATLLLWLEINHPAYAEYVEEVWNALQPERSRA